MTLLRLILSPIGRWLSAASMILAAFGAAYLKGRREGAAKLKQEQADERDRRTRAALDEEARARNDIARGRLFANDGHRRD